MVKTWSAALAATTLALTLAACNTVAGAGQDIESAADTVEEEI